ncbi:hypothetical protein [Massilia oculi]|uniref:hypothetical protein n=1 Tax=Massilia oculi TaxID=945844 RepID=UPI001AAECAB4|nr:hypothetical protein [Massilia oculi]
MSSLEIHCLEVILQIEKSSGESATIGSGAESGSVTFFPYSDTAGGISQVPLPALDITVASDHEDTSERVTLNFKIMGRADIDALRRYCEMALDHFEKGFLE